MIQIKHLSHHYQNRPALQDLCLEISQGEIFGVLGPNGSGKSTLLKILSTLLLPQSGEVRINGFDLKNQATTVRKQVGVLFQSPSLDGKLKVSENLRHQGHLYGLKGSILKQRTSEMMRLLGIEDRAEDLVEKLSGGLKRRVEIAKGFLHEPSVLFLDEPTNGLDPGARRELWDYLLRLRHEKQVSIVVATHLMDEAEQCSRVAIIDQGKVLSLGTPESLKEKIGGEVLLIKSKEGPALAKQIKQRFHVEVFYDGRLLQVEHQKGHHLMAQLYEAFPGQIEEMTLRGPSLEDVFLHRTGHRFSWAPVSKKVDH